MVSVLQNDCKSWELSRHYHRQKETKLCCRIYQYRSEKYENSSSVKLLGVHIDDKLNFNVHITKICRSEANQLHAPIRLRVFLNFEEKKTLINTEILITVYLPGCFLAQKH